MTVNFLIGKLLSKPVHVTLDLPGQFVRGPNHSGERIDDNERGDKRGETDRSDRDLAYSSFRDRITGIHG